MTPEQFTLHLKIIAAADTSADPAGWTTDNPLWGHCAVAALLAQDYFGGELVRGDLANHPKYAYLRSHYWNRLPDGQDIDFTSSQYTDLSCTELTSEVRDRNRMLAYPDTKKRYELLKERFEDAVD
jgi:hypothetical protein